MDILNTYVADQCKTALIFGKGNSPTLLPVGVLYTELLRLPNHKQTQTSERLKFACAQFSVVRSISLEGFVVLGNQKVDKYFIFLLR